MPSFYTPQLTEKCSEVVIKEEEFHHITNVFRHKVSEQISLNNGSGLLAKATIEEVNKKNLIVEINEVIVKTKSKPEIAIAFSLLRNKNDFVLTEKITELGVFEVFPFTSKFTVRKPNKNTTDKFEKIAISAIKQCDNAFLPKINECLPLKEMIRKVESQNYKILIASEKIPEQTIASFIQDFPEEKVCFIVGPEGGFSDEEFSYFKEKNFYHCKLGNHILRGETAAITAISQAVSQRLLNNPDFY